MADANQKVKPEFHEGDSGDESKYVPKPVPDAWSALRRLNDTDGVDSWPEPLG